MEFTIGGIGLAVLILGIVEAAKEFGITGKGSQGLALFLGIFFIGLAQAIAESLVPEVYMPWIRVGVVGLAGGLAAMGYYDLSKRWANGGKQ